VVVAQDLLEGEPLDGHGPGAPLIEADAVPGPPPGEIHVGPVSGADKHRAANHAGAHRKTELVGADLQGPSPFFEQPHGYRPAPRRSAAGSSPATPRYTWESVVARSTYPSLGYLARDETRFSNASVRAATACALTASGGQRGSISPLITP